MTTTKNILSSLAIAATMTLTSTAALAHSDHDHSTVSYKWAMSKNLQAKIDNRLDSSNPTSLIGLNPFEQKKLEHYEINVGNKFNTETRGISFLMERTSAGMKIVDANRVGKVSYTDQVPIKKTNLFSKISMTHKSHTGHDHAHLPYEWTFGLSTQDKIVRGIVQNEENILVGLNAFEQSLLREYDIQPGNTFHTTIAGHPFLIEKTSSGIKVINHTDVKNVATVTHNHENM
jgi:hypothetical protein